MTAAVINFILKFLSLSWLTGPIFDKELRVSSRRRRNYLLRFVYLALLAIFVVLVWLESVRYSGSALHQASRMAEAGKAIIATIIWFQFIAIQMVAVIMLSNSISDEIYNRTLGVLMTTPINSFQIVVGKLFSKLLQLILLLGISLPLLAIVRIFGGVPWNYVVSSLCITLTTAIFVGLVSLFFSVYSRRAYTVIILTVLSLAFLFGLVPLLAALFCEAMDLHSRAIEKILGTIFFNTNPYAAMGLNTEMMFNPRSIMRMPFSFSWTLLCGILLTASSLILLVSVSRVRKAALRQATGQLDTSGRKRRRKKTSESASSGTIRPINGSPAIWKELRAPLFRGHRVAAFVAISLGMILLVVSYLLFAAENALRHDEVQIFYVLVLLSVAMLFTIILPATCITSEKESRSWPLLLATTLSDWQIIFAKFVGTLRRCLIIWLILFCHLILFVAFGYLHPVVILQTAILVTWIIAFLCSSGLYFSSVFKRTTTAVIMNFVLPGIIWVLMPFLLLIGARIVSQNDDFVEVYLNINPFAHAGIIVNAGCHQGIDGYDWPGFGGLNAFESTTLMLFWMVCYLIVSFLFFWRAKCRLRRNIF